MPDRCAWVKFASPSFAEWWRWDSDYIYHHEDRSDGLDAPYHFAKDRWIKRRWAVGDEIDSRDDNFILRTFDGGDNWSTKPWAMVLRFVAAFDAYPCGGAIGNAPCIVVEYDPTYTLEPRRGYVERFWFALGWGWWRWQSFPFGTTPDWSPVREGRWSSMASIQQIQDRRRRMLTDEITTAASESDLIDAHFRELGGVRVAPIDPVRPWSEPPVEPPGETPMPGKPYDEQFFLNTAAPMKDGDPSGACNQAIADYAAVGRPVDGQYSIWFTRTEHDYQNGGLTLPASWKKHRNEMRALLDPSGQVLPPFL